MASVCFLAFMLSAGSSVALKLSTTDGITVAMVTWNTADMHIDTAENEGKKVLDEAFALAKHALKSEPDIWAIALQETMVPQCDEIDQQRWLNLMNPNINSYLFVSEFWRKGKICKTYHGSSGIIVFATRKWYSNIGKVGNFASGDKTFPNNNEKGISAVWFETLDEQNVFCFASSHLQTGDNLASDMRLTSFTKYSEFFDDFSDKLRPSKSALPKKASCTVKFYGGDFNWRNGEWSDKAKWKSDHHSDDEVIRMFANMKPGWHDSVKNEMIIKEITQNGIKYKDSSNKAYTVPKILQMKDERSKLSGKWMEGNVPQVKGSPITYPTFQPFPIEKCKGKMTLNRNTNVVNGSLAKEANLIHSFTEEKSKACYQIDSDDYEFCEKKQICFSDNRPLAFTDCIFHEGDVNAVKYGPMMIPVPADHFPVLGTYRMF